MSRALVALSAALALSARRVDANDVVDDAAEYKGFCKWSKICIVVVVIVAVSSFSWNKLIRRRALKRREKRVDVGGGWRRRGDARRYPRSRRTIRHVSRHFV